LDEFENNDLDEFEYNDLDEIFDIEIGKLSPS
jgi:hypothetical protein